MSLVPASLDRAERLACVDGEPVQALDAVQTASSATSGAPWRDVRTLWLDALEAGEHELRLLLRGADGRVFEASGSFALSRGEHPVRLSVLDGEGEPTAARVAVRRGGLPWRLDVGARSLDKHGRDHPSTSVFLPREGGVLWLDAGTYELTALRGVRDELDVVEVEVAGPVEQVLVVRRQIDDPRISADLHVHSARSFDSILPDAARFRALAASGVDLAVLTDHNLTDAALPPADGVSLVPGVEADVRERDTSEGRDWDLAHLNAFPVAPGLALPSTVQPTIGAVLDAYRARQALSPFPGSGAALLLQLNHPRGIHFRPDERPQRGAWPMFNTLGFDPLLPIGRGMNAWLADEEPGTGTTALHLDAMEILNRFSFELYLEVRDDWFSLLSQGVRLTGTGNSDSHGAWVELVGFPVNLVSPAVLRDDGAADPAALVEQIAGGRVTVTTGPVLHLSVRGAQGELVGPGDTAVGAREAVVRVQAASWVPVAEVRLVVNGEVVEVEQLDDRVEGEPLDRTLRWPLEPGADAWVLAEAGWPVDGAVGPEALPGGHYGRLLPGYVPLGFTNPVWVDVAGDGWVAPGL